MEAWQPAHKSAEEGLRLGKLFNDEQVVIEAEALLTDITRKENAQSTF